MALTLFEALVITHLIMDWIFQWKWEALNKTKKWLALCFHCSVYTVGFIPVFLVYKVSFLWLILLFVSHFIIDQGNFKTWLLENFKRVKKEDISETAWQILLTGVDQVLHFAILTLVVIFS